MKKYPSILLLLSILLYSCSTSGPGAFIFGKKSPHEQYGQSLINAGLRETALGRSWFAEGEKSLNKPLKVDVPYKEVGYFPAEKARAVSLQFTAKRGEKLSISLTKKPGKGFTIYADLWEVRDNNNKKLLAYADTTGEPFSYEVDDNATYLLRLQPELLTSGEYTLTITNGPSLAFPIKNGKIGSFWGADRDGGARRHEGIDIFAPRRTPALAAADGTINRVTLNQLGGKVIFLRPKGKNYSLYYAHLDEQLVSFGQQVKVGDTIGLVGNTGNAISTSPHLHFGIYGEGGAIDPLTFVNPVQKSPPLIKSSLSNLGTSMRTENKGIKLMLGLASDSETLASLSTNTLVEVVAVSDNKYKVALPDGNYGFITSSLLSTTDKSLKQIQLSTDKPLFDQPDSQAARKALLNKGETVTVIGNYRNYYYVRAAEDNGWISSANSP